MDYFDCFNNWVDKHRNELIDFLKKYISYRSIRGNEENQQKEFLYEFFKNQMNWDKQKLVFINKNRPNVNGYLFGSGSGRSLLINGHSDVVDVTPREAPKWETDPWQGIVKAGKVYGRGSCDMKGPNTAALWAIKGLMDLGVELSGDLFMNLVIGEETNEQEIGVIPSTKDILNEKNTAIDFCLNVEPTSLEIHTVGCGNFDFAIDITGKEIHTSMKSLASYPQRWGVPSGREVGIDASQVLAEILIRLKKLEHRWNMHYRHEILGGGGWPNPMDRQGTGNSSINCTIIKAGEYIGAMPGSASIEGHIYYPPNAEPEKLKDDICRVIKGTIFNVAGLEEEDLKVEFSKKWHWKPFEISREHSGCKELAESLRKFDINPVYSGMKSVVDNAFIESLGIPVVSCGPGMIANGVHGPNEFIDIEEMIKAAKLFGNFIINWCNTNKI